MSAVAELAPQPAVTIRRFEIPDLDRHGRWIMRRLLKTYTHLNEQQMQGWLRGLIYSPEYLFLYQPHAVAMAQLLRPNPLDPKSVVWERFVFAEEGHVEEAASFYSEFQRWAKSQNPTVEVIIVNEMTDVPQEMIKDRIGRLFSRQQWFVRL